MALPTVFVCPDKKMSEDSAKEYLTKNGCTTISVYRDLTADSCNAIVENDYTRLLVGIKGVIIHATQQNIKYMDRLLAVIEEPKNSLFTIVSYTFVDIPEPIRSRCLVNRISTYNNNDSIKDDLIANDVPLSIVESLVNRSGGDLAVAQLLHRESIRGDAVKTLVSSYSKGVGFQSLYRVTHDDVIIMYKLAVEKLGKNFKPELMSPNVMPALAAMIIISELEKAAE